MGKKSAIPEVENPVVDVSVEPVAADAQTEGEALAAAVPADAAATLDAVGAYLMDQGHGEGGMPLAAAVVEASVVPAGRRVNFKAHGPVDTEDEAKRLVAGMPAGSFYKKNENPYAPKVNYRVYEAI